MRLGRLATEGAAASDAIGFWLGYWVLGGIVGWGELSQCPLPAAL